MLLWSWNASWSIEQKLRSRGKSGLGVIERGRQLCVIATVLLFLPRGGGATKSQRRRICDLLETRPFYSWKTLGTGRSVLGPFFGGWRNFWSRLPFSVFFLFLSAVARDWNSGAPTQIIKIAKTKEFPPLVFFFFRMAKTERLPLRFTTYTPFFNISRGHGVRSEFPDKAISCPIWTKAMHSKWVPGFVWFTDRVSF